MVDIDLSLLINVVLVIVTVLFKQQRNAGTDF